MRTSIIATLLTVLLTTGTTSSIADDDIAHAAKVTVLSSNLANGATIGEWGFSAMVQTARIKKFVFFKTCVGTAVWFLLKSRLF